MNIETIRALIVLSLAFIALFAIVELLVFNIIRSKKTKPVGDLVVYSDDPGVDPILLLELEAGTDVHELIKKKSVTLRVVYTENYSQNKHLL